MVDIFYSLSIALRRVILICIQLGYDDQTSMELICQENGEWGGTEVFECVHQGNNELEGYAIASIVIGGILGLILISVSAVCGKR